MSWGIRATSMREKGLELGSKHTEVNKRERKNRRGGGWMSVKKGRDKLTF